MAKRITSLNVLGLHGTIDYPEIQMDGGLEHLSLLYGENGSGKTTILNMLYCLLSCETNQGNKTRLANIKFTDFRVNFHDNSYVRASRKDLDQLDYEVEIKGAKGASSSWIINAPEGRVRLGTSPQIRACMQALRELDINIVFLTEDRLSRGLTSTSSMYPSRNKRFKGAAEWEESISRGAGEFEIEHLKNFYLDRLLDQVEFWFQRSANVGKLLSERQANNFYIDFLDALISDQNRVVVYDDLLKQLSGLEARIKKLSRFSMMYRVPFNTMMDKVNRIESKSEKELAIKVLQPYISGIEARVSQLEVVARVFDLYVSSLNSFLARKSIEFNLRRGVFITDSSGARISPRDLSSGERQLLHLFSTILISRDLSSIVLIDEPELSLSAKWQRKLANVLVGLNADSDTQLIMATHSVEILTEYKDSVVRLRGNV